MALIMSFLFIVAAIAAGAWAWNRFGGKSPCGCKDSAGVPLKV
jgi:hypothetical protein